MSTKHQPPPPRSPAHDLTVRFVRQLPSEEVIDFARRCAREYAVLGPLTIVLEPKPGPDRPVHQVRLERSGRVLATESNPEVLLALRHAFDRVAHAGAARPELH